MYAKFDEWTALYFACKFERHENVKLLVYHGANPNLETKVGAPMGLLTRWCF